VTGTVGPQDPATHNGEWDPLHPDEVLRLLDGLAVPWWIAGGWAIDLFVGRQTREHADTDILVLRRDQLAVQRHLGTWDLFAAEKPLGLRPWLPGQFLPRGIHDIWCRRHPTGPWVLQLMLAEDDGDEWFLRRNPAVRGRIGDLGRRTPEGVPYLAPEIQLLYKARAERQPKDEADFAVAWPLLDDAARLWLARALQALFPEGHSWLHGPAQDDARPPPSVFPRSQGSGHAPLPRSLPPNHR